MRIVHSWSEGLLSQYISECMLFGVFSPSGREMRITSWTYLEKVFTFYLIMSQTVRFKAMLPHEY